VAGKNGDVVVIALWYLTMGALVRVGDAKNLLHSCIGRY